MSARAEAGRAAVLSGVQAGMAGTVGVLAHPLAIDRAKASAGTLVTRPFMASGIRGLVTEHPAPGEAGSYSAFRGRDRRPDSKNGRPRARPPLVPASSAREAARTA